MNEPIEYLDGKKVTRQLRDEAEDVLKARYGRGTVSDDFADGFIDGYADYLEHGGNTAPPAVPPLKYRRGKFLNADGHARIHDYFCGFQAGADTAAESGKRQFLTIPILVPDPPVAPPVNARQIPAEQCAPGQTGVGLPNQPTELLPPPRPEPTAGLPAPNRPVVAPAPTVPLPTVKVDPLPPPETPVYLPNTRIPVPHPTRNVVDPPIAEPPPPEIPAPKTSTPVLTPPPAGYRSISTTGVPPADPDAIPRTVIPPLRELPHKPGHSPVAR